MMLYCYVVLLIINFFMKKDIILFGIQWCGKWTQANKLLDTFLDEFAYLSTGDVFRALTSQPNAIGDYVKKKINSGELIPDDVTIALFHTYFQTVLDSDKNMLLDWYPRTKKQIDNLFKLAEKENRELLGIYFDLSEEEAIERMKWRGRKDDTEDGIRYRLQQYYDKTVPVIDYFESKGKLIKINVDRSIEEIFVDFKKAVA